MVALSSLFPSQDGKRAPVQLLDSCWFFQELHQLDGLDFILDFVSQIVKFTVFPSGVDLLFQGHYSTG
jgi:hypothetical protein